MKDSFRDWAATYHIHVDDSLDALRKFRLGIQQRLGTLDLRRPDKPDSSLRRRQFAFFDQLLQRARDFENGHTSAGIVIGSRPLMIEMATEGDLFALELGIGARNRAGHNLVTSRMLSRADHSMKPHLLAMRQPLTQRSRHFKRSHESKGPDFRK